ncbi:MAG: hypothetical protein L0Z07_00360 [Planctomycetes bacterium]|nr:hypothetical protein [Planctomycetota bacterium]
MGVRNIQWEDANYRTLSARGQRVIRGFSMGGFGAAKFAETFGVCVIYDGALHTWPTLNNAHPDIVTEILSGSESGATSSARGIGQRRTPVSCARTGRLARSSER